MSVCQLYILARRVVFREPLENVHIRASKNIAETFLPLHRMRNICVLEKLLEISVGENGKVENDHFLGDC